MLKTVGQTFGNGHDIAILNSIMQRTWNKEDPDKIESASYEVDSIDLYFHAWDENGVEVVNRVNITKRQLNGLVQAIQDQEAKKVPEENYYDY